MSDDIPRSRGARGAAVARLAAGQAVRTAGTRAANVARSPERARAALDHRQLEAAEQIVRVLGTMKGAAMKVGQMLSIFDLGPEITPRLAKLRDAAPKVAFERMRGVVEAELGTPLGGAFADFDPEPIGAASIGQVYAATLRDGRRVAVKVQYPGIATAVRADLKNMALLMRIIRRQYPGLDTERFTEELRTRIGEELDYELEAANQAAAAERFRDHPFVVVPEVVPELCSTQVLVAELVEGDGFEAIRAAPDAVRDRVGEIVFRFYCGGMYRLGQFSGDPHPGNFLLLADGRVAFLDFGLYKRMGAERLALEIELERAAAGGDADEIARVMRAAGYVADGAGVAPAELLALVDDALGWCFEDAPVRLAPARATTALLAALDPRGPHVNLPAEHLIARRVALFTLAVLGQLRAEANWYRIACEWLHGDAPVTELGRAEAPFYAEAR
jgi:predicted unusual protein kinase regulating ubiquinone biosynthesis (AarF/ABC1/UbiB family)